MPSHRYEVRVAWTGNLGAGTTSYGGYGREHRIDVDGKPPLLGSSDPAFRGDASRYNPEELLVAALSACHLLWYLHLCADAGIDVAAYEDRASGELDVARETGGRFVSVTLRPRVRIRAGAPERAAALHDEAHRRCFIANSVNFPVRHEPVVERA